MIWEKWFFVFCVDGKDKIRLRKSRIEVIDFYEEEEGFKKEEIMGRWEVEEGEKLENGRREEIKDDESGGGGRRGKDV